MQQRHVFVRLIELAMDQTVPAVHIPKGGYAAALAERIEALAESVQVFTLTQWQAKVNPLYDVRF